MENPTLFTDDDLHLWKQGTHYRLYRKLGAHPGPSGTRFAVWAPNADHVAVIGEWNDWEADADPLRRLGTTGIWEGMVGEAETGHAYKYAIGNRRHRVDKADPFGFHHETAPRTASKVWDLSYRWGDEEWMASRGVANALDAPISIYEMHLGSWRRGERGRHLTYLELAERLPEYLEGLGFTHVEFLPVMEHPFYGSWGYQTTGYFAPTSRYGTPQDFMTLVDALHQTGIGVILDWVPSHFPADEHGLGRFDGTHLFEHADPRKGFHPDWDTYIYDYGRAEVPAFLISNALFWLDHYHADALRVDAVASMLYLDYSRAEGKWVPNVFGGRENLEAAAFLRRLNEVTYAEYPETHTMAEESTAWPMVSRPTSEGGLGFGFKWDMGWMHDTLVHLSREPALRAPRLNEMTFRAMYAFSENFVLPLSHDEVVYGKRSLLEKMPGDDSQQRAGLRLLLAYMFTLPGKKLLFMGAEMAQRLEWAHDGELQWELLQEAGHREMSHLVADLNSVYRGRRALHRLDCEPGGFEWAVADDTDNCVLAFFRHSGDGESMLVAVNLTLTPRLDYPLGVPEPGRWEEVLNTDAARYGGNGLLNRGALEAVPQPHRHRTHRIEVDLPPLSVVALARESTGRWGDQA